MPTVTIDDREYDTDSLSDDAKQQIGNLNVCDQKIRQLQQELAIVQTARQAYATALQNALPTDD